MRGTLVGDGIFSSVGTPHLDVLGLWYRILDIDRGVEQSVAREAHNLKAAGSSPAPAILSFLRVLDFQCNPLHSLEI